MLLNPTQYCLLPEPPSNVTNPQETEPFGSAMQGFSDRSVQILDQYYQSRQFPLPPDMELPPFLEINIPPFTFMPWSIITGTNATAQTPQVQQNIQAQVDLFQAQAEVFRVQIDTYILNNIYGTSIINPITINDFTLAKNYRKDTILHESNLILLKKIGVRKFRQLRKKGYFEELCKYGILQFHGDGAKLIESRKYGNRERKLEWKLCIQSLRPDLPKGDVILSRWLEFKADEDKFFDTANFRSVTSKDEVITR